MKLKEMKAKVFSLIEEYYPNEVNLAEDEDVINKINGVVNQVQLDLMKYRKIPAHTTIEIGVNDDKTITFSDLIDDLYQLNTLYFHDTVDYIMPDDNTLILPDNFVGNVEIYYYKYPTLVKTLFTGTSEEQQIKRTKEDNNYTFELDMDILEVMPYGIAADLLKMDMISNYGQYFESKYNALKQTIDSRKTSGSIVVSGGTDI